MIDETKADAITARAFAQSTFAFEHLLSFETERLNVELIFFPEYLESVLTAAQDDSLSLDEKIKEIDLFLAVSHFFPPGSSHSLIHDVTHS